MDTLKLDARIQTKDGFDLHELFQGSIMSYQTNKMTLFMEIKTENCVRNSRGPFEIDNKCACQFHS